MIVRCNFCDKKFSRSPSGIKGSQFCSKKCWYSFKKGKLAIKFTEAIRVKISEALTGKKRDPNSIKRGKDNPSWRGGNIEVICLKCGKTFFCKPSEIKNGRKYCSLKCCWESRLGMPRSIEIKKKITKTKRSRFSRFTIVCKNCGNTVSVPNCRKKTAHFCSLRCRNDYLKQFGISQEQKNKLRKINLGKIASQETRKKMGDARRGKKLTTSWLHNILTFRSPNKIESVLNHLLKANFPHEWKFVGDGKVIIEGKNPDFININGKKQIIELFGERWHDKNEAQPRIDLFTKYGYKTLILWVKELSYIYDSIKNKEVVEKVKEFTEGGEQYAISKNS